MRRREYAAAPHANPDRPDGFLDKLRTLVRQHDAPVYTISYYMQWQLMSQVAALATKFPSAAPAPTNCSAAITITTISICRDAERPDHYAPALAAWRRRRADGAQSLPAESATLCRTPQDRDHIYLDADEFVGYLRSLVGAVRRDRLHRPAVAKPDAQRAVPRGGAAILHEDDLNAMYYSVENRSPFLDRDLFEQRCKFRPGT